MILVLFSPSRQVVVVQKNVKVLPSVSQDEMGSENPSSQSELYSKHALGFNQITFSEIVFGEALGEGAFGTVCKVLNMTMWHDVTVVHAEGQFVGE